MVTHHTRRDALLSGLSIVGAVSVGGCVSSSDSVRAEPVTVRVGSKSFTENRVLGHLIYELLKSRDDIRAVNHINYDNETEAIWDGLVSGHLDVYWEYSGSLWHEIAPKRSRQYHDLTEMYQNAARDIEKEYDLDVLSMAPFNNSYGLVTTRAWVTETGIDSISGLAAYLNDGHTDVVAGVNPGPYRRRDAWAGMLDHYGVREEVYREWDKQRENILLLPAGGTYNRLMQGTVDLILGFTSDAQIKRHDLLVLEDDDNYWSVYSPAPVVQGWLSADYPEIQALVDQIGPAIGDIETIRRLSGNVLFEDRFPGEVATEFLRDVGLL